MRPLLIPIVLLVLSSAVVASPFASFLAPGNSTITGSSGNTTITITLNATTTGPEISTVYYSACSESDSGTGGYLPSSGSSEPDVTVIATATILAGTVDHQVGNGGQGSAAAGNAAPGNALYPAALATAYDISTSCPTYIETLPICTTIATTYSSYAQDSLPPGGGDYKGAGVASAVLASPVRSNGSFNAFSSLAANVSSLFSSSQGYNATAGPSGALTSTILMASTTITTATATSIIATFATVSSAPTTTPSHSPILLGVNPVALRRKRQTQISSSTFIDSAGQVTSDCSSAAQFAVFSSGSLENLGTGTFVTVDFGMPNEPLVANGVSSVTSTGFDIVGGVLTLSNPSFSAGGVGLALFYESANGSLGIAFTAAPGNSTTIQISTIPASLCVNGVIIGSVSSLMSSPSSIPSYLSMMSSSSPTSIINSTSIMSPSSSVSTISSTSATSSSSSLSSATSSTSTLLSSSYSITTSSSPSPTVSMVFDDEFDGDSLNLTYWSYQNGNGCNINLCGWGNGEQETYATSQVSVANGLLTITAQLIDGQWYSGKLISQAKVFHTYGRLEARILLPTGDGLFPAFWMLPNDPSLVWPEGGEIDIAEYESIWTPSVTPATVHYQQDGQPAYTSIADNTLYTSDAFANGQFHIYGIEWTEENIAFTRDGVIIGYYLNDGTNIYPFTHDFFIILNLAIGPSFGSPVPADITEATLQVDYVRWYA
ncbi:MAG: hypothetical protein M1827_004877 [Pycnora praestabilis]|nr:MAG: hypothetical protein M1827_004877 [Pycnora praestabilis]